MNEENNNLRGCSRCGMSFSLNIDNNIGSKICIDCREIHQNDGLPMDTFINQDNKYYYNKLVFGFSYFKEKDEG